MAIVTAICECYRSSHIKITVACNGLSAIRKAMSDDTNYSCRSILFFGSGDRLKDTRTDSTALLIDGPLSTLIWTVLQN
eukprot:7939466-Ditylum_brightwellii.AAC.1